MHALWALDCINGSKPLLHSPAPIKRHLSFVRAPKLGSIVSLGLNLAFYFFHFSETWKEMTDLYTWPKCLDHTMFRPNSPPCFLHSFFLLCFSLLCPSNPNTHKHRSIRLFWMQRWTMASSLEAGRLEWNEIWLVNVQSSRTHLGIHLCQINRVHSWWCLCREQNVNGTHIVLGFICVNIC